MRTVILTVALLVVGFEAKSQDFVDPIVLKSFDKDTKRNIWYTSKKPGETNIRTIIGDNSNMTEYYKKVLTALEFDPSNPNDIDGIVMIWEDYFYTVRVSITNHTTIITVIDK